MDGEDGPEIVAESERPESLLQKIVGQFWPDKEIRNDVALHCFGRSECSRKIVRQLCVWLPAILAHRIATHFDSVGVVN